MKTIEELQNMQNDDLIREVQQLQKEVQKGKSNTDFWFNEHKKIKSKFEAFRDATKSLVILID